MPTDSIEEIAVEIRKFVMERFKVPADDPDFHDDIHLFDYGYVDSFGAVDLTTFVEQRFGVKISESDLVAFPLNTIQEIAVFVLNRKAK